MNWALYRSMFREQSKTILAYSGGIISYELLITWVYPKLASSPAVSEIPKAFPNPVKSAFGVSGDNDEATFEAYICGQLFGRIWPIILSVYSVNTADSLSAKLIDQGFLAFPLSAPVKRLDIFLTLETVLLSGVGLITASTLAGLYAGTLLFGIEINYLSYFLLGILGFAFFSAIGAYCFLISVSMNDHEQSLRYAAGLTFLFYILDVAAALAERYAWIEDLTLFSLFRPQAVLEGRLPPGGNIKKLIAITAGLTFLSSLIFWRKDLPV